jgi:hypothetical protein
MPSLDEQQVRSPAFTLDLRGRDPAAFVREVEDGAMRIVGRYVARTEALQSWDICGSNIRLNRVFELNRLPYDGYLGDDAVVAVDRHGKKPVVVAEEGPSQEATPATKKRKIGTAVGGLGVSDRFAVELMGTCAALRGRMSSPELWESSARMLKVTGGRWPRNVLIPRPAGEDIFTSHMARELKIFPYGRNIAAVVSAVMERDRQDMARKRQAVTKDGDPFREAKKARGGGGGRKLCPPGPHQTTPAHPPRPPPPRPPPPPPPRRRGGRPPPRKVCRPWQQQTTAGHQADRPRA